MANDLFMPEDQLFKFINSAPIRYKRYNIKKRNGKGVRTIAQPSRQVKALQRIVVDLLRDSLPIHETAAAYELGRGIKFNAQLHLHSSYLLKMDFRNFFPSINPELFLNICARHEIQLTKQDEDVLSHLLFWKLQRNSPLRLSIGAPSSPFISNVVMYFFDQEMVSICSQLDVTYSRYADDLTFTTNRKGVLFDIPNLVGAVLRAECIGKIKVNKNKTVISSKGRNRHVTGITLTNDNKLSLGRKKKRILSSLIHKSTLDILSPKELESLKGQLGFAKHVEPEFIARMKVKYGREEIIKIQKYNK